MSLIEKMKQIEHVDFLIKRKSTGTPKALSSKLGISERQVYNIINTMKEMGAPIYFCSINQCYCYEEDVTFKFGFIAEEQVDVERVRGGTDFRIQWLSLNGFKNATSHFSTVAPVQRWNLFAH